MKWAKRIEIKETNRIDQYLNRRQQQKNTILYIFVFNVKIVFMLVIKRKRTKHCIAEERFNLSLTEACSFSSLVFAFQSCS